MSTFSYQGDPTQYGNNNRTLPKDQQKLADAAADQGNKEGAGIQGVAERTGNLADISSTGSFINTITNKITRYNPKAIIRSATQLNPNDKLTAKVLRGVGRGLFGTGKGSPKGYGRANLFATVGNIASEVYRPFDEEERSGYQAFGEDVVGEKFGEALYGDLSRGPITPEEMQAIRDNKNLNRPTTETVNNTSTGPFNPSAGYGGSREVITGYEPMPQKSQEELAKLAAEDYASQFGRAYQNRDGSYTGLTTAGKKQSMTPDQYASFAEQQRLGLGNQGALPMGDYTPVAGTQGFVQQPLGYEPPAPQATQSSRDMAVAKNEARLDALRSGGELSQDAKIMSGQMEAPEGFYNPAPATGPYIPQAPTPRAPQISKQMEAQSNFKVARDAGNITQDKIRAAEEYAASMGRTFDKNMGYSSEFDQSILDKYNAERNASQQGGQYGGQQNTQQAQGRSSYATESAAREARMDARPDFGSAQMRDSSGKMVNVTPENREKRDIEKGLKQEAKAAGYTPAQTRAYVADQMRERSESASDRAFDLKLREQNFSQGEANLARTLKGLQEETDVEEEDYFGIISGLGDLGVGIDTETGNLSYMKEDGGFAGWFDKKVNLTPDSELYNKVMQMKGGAAFLAPPQYVQRLAKDAKEGDSILAEDGTGRVYQVKNGELVQTK